MEWRFKDMADDETRTETNLDEFFLAENDTFKNFAVSLVREDVQNRLDAKNPELGSEVPAKVRYFLSTSGDDSDRKIAAWLKPLKEHCNSKQCVERMFGKSLDVFEKPLRYLTIECFNTTGLKGDPTQCNESEEGIEKNDFYWMFRNVGRSGKSRLKGKRGSWGVGKIVYHLASRAMAYFCYSVSGGKTAFMGKTQLVPHWIAGQGKRDVGFFAEFSETGFANPLQDASDLVAQDFCRDFNVSRTPFQSGVSIVIPFCRDDIRRETLVVSTIRSYLWEILKGHVEITIETDDGKPAIALKKETVKPFIKEFFPETSDNEKVDKEKFLAFHDFFAQIIIDRVQTDYIKEYTIAEPKNFSAVEVAQLFASEEEFNEAKASYQAGGIVQVIAPVTIRRREPDDTITKLQDKFEVYLQKDEMQKPQISLIRDGLTILDLEMHRGTLLRALTLIEHAEGEDAGPLSDFLRAAESPSHTDFSADRKALANRYQKGGVLLKYVCDLMWKLASAFTDIEGQEDPDALMDWFGFEGDEAVKAFCELHDILAIDNETEVAE